MFLCEICGEHKADDKLNLVWLCYWCATRVRRFLDLQAGRFQSMPGMNTSRGFAGRPSE